MNVTVANELEGRLTAVNPQPALLQAPSSSRAGTKGSGPMSERQEKRNQMEKDRRGRERYQLERICLLFKVAPSGKPWSRKNALCFGEILFHVVLNVTIAYKIRSRCTFPDVRPHRLPPGLRRGSPCRSNLLDTCRLE